MMSSRAFASNPVAMPSTQEESLLGRFNRDYNCRLADNPQLLQQAFETRFQVYCVENEFENPAEHRQGLETDEFDANSRHCVLVYAPTGEALGTVRLVLPERGILNSFSMRHILTQTCGRSELPLHTTAEVSRFSISKRSRREVDRPLDNVRSLVQRSNQVRRAEPMMSLGLIQGLVRMSALHNITHWCAVMEPKMLRMLAAMGIHFTPVGPLIEHHGLRQLCYCEVDSVLRTVRAERPTFWEIITDGGKLAAVRNS